MLRFFFLLFILTFSLYGLSDTAMLKRANSLMKVGDKSNQFRAYNDYKNLYLRSIMNEDKNLKISSLKGIVSSGNKLHIDVSQYSSELSELSKSSYKKPKLKLKPNTTTVNSKKIKVKSSHKLESIGFKDDKLVLKFDKILNKKQLNYFTMYDKNTKRYKYVFDIHASMLRESKKLRKENITRIKLAQYNPTTIRLVIENDKKIDLSFKKESSKLIISLSNNSTSSPKPIVVSKYISPKRLDRNKVIVIDAGHGGKDPGAVGYKKYREKIVVMQISQELRTILKSRGYKVYMTRDRDNFVKLSNRTKFANKKNADIFISIHANAVAKKNASKVHGLECYFLSKSRSSRAKKVAAKENSADMSDMNFYGKKSFLNTLSSHNIVASNKLAIDLQRGMLGSLKKSYSDIHDGGVREGPFWVLVGAQMPSVLVEVGFISHPTEAKRLVNSKYQKKIALGMANGIERYFLNN